MKLSNPPPNGLQGQEGAGADGVCVWGVRGIGADEKEERLACLFAH